ncbi:MAG: hypothetical protein AMXMBFR7_14180 [Planctomycetota bacterium]
MTARFRIAFVCAAWCFAASLGAADGPEGWELVPTTDTDRLEASLLKEHTPTLEKHFTFSDGVLAGKMNLGKPFFEGKKIEALQGIGTVWAARKDWPRDLGDFEMSWDFQWVMPDKGFADCPFMLVGFRLNEKGEGYSIGLHGYSAPLQIQRIKGDRTVFVGRGRYKGYIHPGWLSLRVRCAGPQLKAKVWKAGTPEPERWTTEAFDDWSAAAGADFRQGRIAFGFSGARVFDTASHEYRNIKFRPLTPEEVKAEVSFDPATGPDYGGDVGETEALTAKSKEEMAKPLPALDAKAAEGWEKTANLTFESGSEGLVLKSTDGAPAFLWMPPAKRASFAMLQAKAAPGGRALLGLRRTGAPEFAYLDPAWREGVAAVLEGSPSHTGDVLRAAYRNDEWFNLVTQRSHIQTWRVLDLQGKVLSAFRYRTGAGFRDTESFGVGVAGRGAVTVKGFSAIVK